MLAVTMNASKFSAKDLMVLFAVLFTNLQVKKWQLRRWMESLKMTSIVRES